MYVLATVAVVLGFFWLVSETFLSGWSPLFAVAYAGFFVGREFWLMYARDEALRLRREREAHGQCPACGYDQTANVTGVCPECGEACGLVKE